MENVIIIPMFIIIVGHGYRGRGYIWYNKIIIIIISEDDHPF